MRIQNNMTAMNTHRYYNIANSSVASSAEKLSSGYRINRAGDDAAGLAISEKMRAQIRGLSMASKNSSDAISLIQTAEGALQSTHNILQRMRELAVQSSSDTNEQVIDRGALQQEFAQLQEEIDEISTTTRFNDQNLLDGTFQKHSSTLNNPGTTLTNVNAVSVSRAVAGIYNMSVTHTAAREAEIIDPGQATEIYQDNLNMMAGSADKVDSVSFSGLKTSDHNGNTYTLKVSASDLENVTFQLMDTNGDIVSTAQNVDVTAWQKGAAYSSANVVNFEDVGSFTFTLNDEITSASDVEAMSGQTVTFAKEGAGYTHTFSMGTLDATALDSVATALESGLSSSTKAIEVEFAPGSAPVTITSASGTPKEYSLKFATETNGMLTASIVDGDGNVIKSGQAGAIGLAKGGTSGDSVEIDLGDFGTVTITNADTAEAALPTAAVTAGYDMVAGELTALETAGGEYDESTVTTAGNTATFTVANLTSGTGDTFAELKATIVGELGAANVTFDAANAADTTAVAATGETFKFTYKDSATGATFNVSLNNAIPGTMQTNLRNVVGAFSNKAISVRNAKSEGATAAVAGTGEFDIGIDVNTETHGTDAASTAATSAVTPSTNLVGGKEQETQAASRAFLTLSINGESVNVYKGDTYVNFANQGIAFEFDALSDENIGNTSLFLDAAKTTGEATVQFTVNDNAGKDMIIQTGANEGDELAMNINRINTEDLGIAYSNIGTRTAASKAITEVNDAINKVSTQRAALGALQNRLDFKIANLDTSAENLQAAESRIRDVDMAKEMTAFSKKNILVQAATAMLAQANSAPQNVLQLLR